MANLKKSKYLLQNLVIKQKMRKNKNSANCSKSYIFEKPLTQQNQISKISKPKCLFKKNWKCANL